MVNSLLDGKGGNLRTLIFERIPVLTNVVLVSSWAGIIPKDIILPLIFPLNLLILLDLK